MPDSENTEVADAAEQIESLARQALLSMREAEVPARYEMPTLMLAAAFAAMDLPAEMGAEKFMKMAAASYGVAKVMNVKGPSIITSK